MEESIQAAEAPAAPVALPGAARDAVARRALAVADMLAAGAGTFFAASLFGGETGIDPFLPAPLIVIMAKLSGSYDREELLLRHSTLEEAPSLFGIATLYSLVVWLLHGGGFTNGAARKQLLVVWVAVFILLAVLRCTARGIRKLLIKSERCVVV